MSLNRLAVLTVSVLVLVGNGFAQKNEISGTIGRTFVSTQSIQGAQFFNPNVHFGDGLSFALNYSHLFRQRGIFGFSLEVPLAVAPDTDLNSGTNLVPASYKAFFITPSARVNFFSGAGVSPWVSAGGGYGLFKESGHAVFFGPNTGPTRTIRACFSSGWDWTSGPGTSGGCGWKRGISTPACRT